MCDKDNIGPAQRCLQLKSTRILFSQCNAVEKGDVAHLHLVLMVLSVHNLAMSSVALTMTVLATAVLVAVTLAACKN